MIIKKSDLLKTIQLKEYIFERLKFSEIPIDEIITRDVFFSDAVYMAGIFLYFRKKKYCIKYVTLYKSEEATYYFDSPDDLLYSFLKYKMSQKAIHETGGYKYKPYALELLKSVDSEYYNRALAEFNNGSW